MSRPDLPRPTLLWIDCTAGALVGVGVIGLAGWLGRLQGLPREVLLILGAANLLYASYSFTLARRAARPLALVRLLVYANASWAVVCVALAIAFRARATPYGMAHLVGEAVFVAVLAALEWRQRHRLATAATPQTAPSAFKDHFSAAAAEYARYRPRYPDALFAHLAALPPARTAAWDCATGSGQAAVALARHFPRVIATDASAEQVAHAEPHPRVEYRTAPAEHSGLPDASVELVTVAQALHWFDQDAFHAEAARVLRPGGILAAWCYGTMEMPSPALQRTVDRYYTETVGPYWPPERRWIEEGYRTLALPFPELDAPPFAMEARLSLDALVGYLGTWSATRRFHQATGRDPLPDLRRALARDWPAPAEPRPVRWPLALRIARRPG